MSERNVDRLVHAQSTAIAVLMNRLGLTTLIVSEAEIDAADATLDMDVKRDEDGGLTGIVVAMSPMGSDDKNVRDMRLRGSR